MNECKTLKTIDAHSKLFFYSFCDAETKIYFLMFVKNTAFV